MQEKLFTSRENPVESKKAVPKGSLFCVTEKSETTSHFGNNFLKMGFWHKKNAEFRLISMWHNSSSCIGKLTAIVMITVIDLYNNGIIAYLVKNGIVSSTMISYIEYFERYEEYRREGRTYRGSIRQVAMEYSVSETTVKKGIRIIQAAQISHEGYSPEKKIRMEETLVRI